MRRSEPADPYHAPGANTSSPNVAAVVLAAGRSSRMGFNKLTAKLWGAPVVAHVVDAVLASRLSWVVVVVGEHESDVRAALASSSVPRIVYNPAFGDGVSTSLRAGIHALPSEVEAALVCLGDMPRVRAEHIDALIEAHQRSGRSICVPVHAQRRGNPVLWPARFFSALAELQGDAGGRQLLKAHASDVCAVEMPDDAVLLDVDTPEALLELEASGRRATNHVPSQRTAGR